MSSGAVRWIEAILCLFLDLLSITACMAMLARLGRLRPEVRKRLFVRQMMWLLSTDTVLHLTLVGVVIVDVSPLPDALRWSQSAFELACRTVYGVNRPLQAVSAVLEVHIAVTFAFQAVRCRPAIWLLSRTIAPTVLVALLCFVYLHFQTHWHMREGIRSCAAGVKVTRARFIQVCFVLCFLSYALILIASCRAPGSVRRRSLCRAATYPGNFLLSYGVLVLICWYRSFARNDEGVALAVAGVCVGGLLNAFTYAWQTGHNYTFPADPWTSRTRLGELETSLQRQGPGGGSGSKTAWYGRPERAVAFGGVDTRAVEVNFRAVRREVERGLRLLEGQAWETDPRATLETVTEESEALGQGTEASRRPSSFDVCDPERPPPRSPSDRAGAATTVCLSR